MKVVLAGMCSPGCIMDVNTKPQKNETTTICCEYSVFQSVLNKSVVVTFLWCALLLQARLAGIAPDVRKLEVENFLRQQGIHPLLPPNIPANTLYRRTSDRKTSPSPSPSSVPSTSKDVKKLRHYEDHLKTSTIAPYARRQLPSSNPWSTLYSTDYQSTLASRHFSPSSQLETEPSTFLDPSSSSAQRIAAPTETYANGERKPIEYPKTQAKDYYRKMYGTEAGVKRLKGDYGPSNLSQAKANYGVEQELEDVRLANEHFLRMRSNIRCRVPVPEVICVKDYYVNPDKEYLPRCTLLHRCGDRSGCCDSDGFRCVPRAIQEVALNFYTVHLTPGPNGIPPENSVEKLLFENHTECECSPLSSPPTSQAPLKDQPTPPPKTTPQPHQEVDYNHHHKDLNPKQTRKCRECPEPFFHREYEDGRCSCDCFDKQKPCIRIKRGREVLRDSERRCVEAGRCHIPECEYGLYISSAGRCPKRPDDINKIGKNGNQQRSLYNHNHRWTFFERD